MTTAYTASNQIPMNALPTTSGTTQQFIVSTTNTADATFAPDGLAAAPIFGLGGAALQGGEIASGGVLSLASYVGPLLNSGALCWVLINCTSGSVQVGSATASHQSAQAGQVASGALATAVAGGTANAITASFPVSPTAYVAGQPFTIIASAANTAAMTAILTLGGTVQSSLPIVKGANLPLVAGDIPAAGYIGEYSYSAAYNALVIQNPATSVSAGIGYGQTWQNLTASRAFGTTYTNSTGKPIVLNIFFGTASSNTSVNLFISLNGGTAFVIGSAQYANGAPGGVTSFIVPPGTTYNLTGASLLANWYELR